MSSINDPFGFALEAYRWYVYLLCASDSACFKVGFTRNPLQRIYSFNARYFDHFDLRRSLLLPMTTEAEARATEALVKKQYASFSVECPVWVRDEAGGHTEWFVVDQFESAAEHACLHCEYAAENAFDAFAGALRAMTTTFEAWAFVQASALRADMESAQLGYERRVRSEPLRDWVDAYLHHGINLYSEDTDVGQFVFAMAHSLTRR